MSATERPPPLRAVASRSDADGTGTSRITSRRVSPVLMTPVPISVAPSASTMKPPIAPAIRFDAAFVGRMGGVGLRTGMEGSVRALWHELTAPQVPGRGVRQGKLQARQRPGVDRIGQQPPQPASILAPGRLVAVRPEAPLAQRARVGRRFGPSQTGEALLEREQRGRRIELEPEA